jgi:hypothetical protein
MNEIELAAWFTYFDQNKDKFKWFFDRYFDPCVWTDLMGAREREDHSKMDIIMNIVWYELPDSRFNIQNNPTGWSEFLQLLEE